jgi:hypothetical protein
MDRIEITSENRRSLLRIPHLSNSIRDRRVHSGSPLAIRHASLDGDDGLDGRGVVDAQKESNGVQPTGHIQNLLQVTPAIRKERELLVSNQVSR